MKPSNRILIVGVALELMFAGLAAFLVMQLKSGAMTAATGVAEASSTIMSVMGIAMGGLGGLIIVIYIVLKQRGS